MNASGAARPARALQPVPVGMFGELYSAGSDLARGAMALLGPAQDRPAGVLRRLWAAGPIRRYRPPRGRIQLTVDVQ